MSLAPCLRRSSVKIPATTLLRSNFNNQFWRSYPAVPDDQPKRPAEKPVDDERQKNMESRVQWLQILEYDPHFVPGMLTCLKFPVAGQAFQSNAGQERNVSSDSEASVRRTAKICHTICSVNSLHSFMWAYFQPSDRSKPRKKLQTTLRSSKNTPRRLQKRIISNKRARGSQGWGPNHSFELVCKSWLVLFWSLQAWNEGSWRLPASADSLQAKRKAANEPIDILDPQTQTYSQVQTVCQTHFNAVIDRN